VNEDERGITPADVTAMTLQQRGPLWEVVIEQGNGDVIKTLELTYMERMQLGMLLAGPMEYVQFVDHTRR